MEIRPSVFFCKVMISVKYVKKDREIILKVNIMVITRRLDKEVTSLRMEEKRWLICKERGRGKHRGFSLGQQVPAGVL